MFTKLFTSSTQSLRDAELGRRAFVLGNGPSILEEDVGCIRDELMIGMNASTMLLSVVMGSRRPTTSCRTAAFSGHPEKRRWATSELSPNTVRFVRGDLRALDDAALRDRTCYVAPLTRDGFSKSLDQGFYYGCTTTMLAVQLAWHLGCPEVYLLGVDLRYSGESPRFYAENRGATGRLLHLGADLESGQRRQGDGARRAASRQLQPTFFSSTVPPLRGVR